jgi:Na+-transporting NADH:ubiquinone oxidoreductase subunit NqrC
VETILKQCKNIVVIFVCGLCQIFASISVLKVSDWSTKSFTKNTQKMTEKMSAEQQEAEIEKYYDEKLREMMTDDEYYIMTGEERRPKNDDELAVDPDFHYAHLTPEQKKKEKKKKAKEYRKIMKKRAKEAKKCPPLPKIIQEALDLSD